jgi:hypothetical protein
LTSQNNLSNNRNEDIPETSTVEVEPTPGIVSGETTPPNSPYAGKKEIQFFQKGQRGPDHQAYKHGQGYSLC